MHSIFKNWYQNSKFDCYSFGTLKGKLRIFENLKMCFIKEVQNFVLIKKYSKFLICISYMQGELNISLTYGFMLSIL